MTVDLWEVRTLPDGLALELHGNPPALVLVQGSDRMRIDLIRGKTMITATGGGVYPLLPVAMYNTPAICYP